MTAREAHKERTGSPPTLTENQVAVSRQTGNPRVLILSTLLLVGLAVQVAMLASHRIHWSSDEAIVGLMARHMLHGIRYPAFYYGSSYAGTLESTFMAAVFSVAGASVASYRASLMILLALLSLIVYWTGRRVFGDASALIAVAYLSVPPFYFLYKGLTSDGAYLSLAVLGAGLLYGAVRLDESEEKGGKSLRWFALIGFLAGLGWWVMTPLIVSFDIAILLWFAIVRPRVFLGARRYFVFVAAFLLGSIRWWWANVGKGWPSLHDPAYERVSSLGAAARGFLKFFTVGISWLLGARPSPNRDELFPGASWIVLLVFAGAVLTAVLFALRRVWGLKSEEPREPSRQARVLLLLLLSVLSMQVVVSLSAKTYRMDPRYLYPFYAPFALLFGSSVGLLVRNRRSRLAAAGLLGGVLAFNGASLLAAPRVDLVTSQPVPVPVTDLIRTLDRLGIRDVYTSFWTVYRLAFESNERIRAASFGEGMDGITRYHPYEQQVARSSNPGFVLWGEEAQRFREYLRSRGSPAREARLGVYQIFWGVSPEVAREMAKLRRVPSE